MPETRYAEVYDNKGNVIAKEPYEVSDEDLERERLIITLNELLKKGKTNWTIEDLKTLVEILLKLTVL